MEYFELSFNIGTRAVLIASALSYLIPGSIHRWFPDGGLGVIAGMAENLLTEELIAIQRGEGIY